MEHVIFGTGPVGQGVMRELVSKGQRVRMVNRSGRLVVPTGVEIVRADASDPTAASALCQGAGVVYNCTNAPYHQWSEKLPPLQAGILAGAAAAGAKLVVMENVYMYGPTGGQPITEGLPYAATSRKGRVRARMAEELLAAHASGKVRVAIGRASDFFGPRVLDSAAGERMFVPALAGKTIQVLGNPDLPHTYSYITDVARGLVLLGEREEALGQAWHLPAPQTVSTRQFVDLIGKETGVESKIQTAPGLLIRALGLFNPMFRELPEMFYEYEEPFTLDHSRYQAAFGEQATSLEEAIRQTVHWFQQHTSA